MELRHLRHFLAVAEELHFARAAKKLGMAQPPLSQSIMRLEKSLGTKLLDRSSRAVQLTAAGKALVPEAREVLARADLAERLVQRVASGELARVSIGFVPMSATLTLPRAVRAFQRDWPHVEVQLHERTSAGQVDALHNGSLDLGILVRDLVDTTGLQLRPIERYSYVAAVPATWPLAGRPSLQLSDLAGSPLVLFPQQLTPNFFTDFEAACRRAGFTPRIQQQVAQPYTMFTLVAEQLGVGIVQDTARHLKIDGITFVPIRDMPASLAHEVALAWVPRSMPPALRDMIAHIRKAARR
jgi:DNA-binding transcriptional LysR family regulator